MEALPGEDVYVGVAIGRWFEARAPFKKGLVHVINDIRRYL